MSATQRDVGGPASSLLITIYHNKTVNLSCPSGGRRGGKGGGGGGDGGERVEGGGEREECKHH